MDHFKIIAGWVVDGTGGPILRNALLEVSKGRLASVGPLLVGNPVFTEKAVIRLPLCTVLPGLVDVHVHLTFSGNIDPEYRNRQLRLSPAEHQPLICEHLSKHLSHGVVAVRDGGDRHASAMNFKNNLIPGRSLPIRVRTAGKAWHAPDRYGSLIGRSPVDGLSLAQSILSYTPRGANHVKIVNSGLNSLKIFGKETAPQFRLDDLRTAIEAARELGLGSMVHANGKTPVRDAIVAGCESIEHGYFMGTENIELMAERQVSWAPTGLSMKAYAGLLAGGSREASVSAANLDHQIHQLALARQCGVAVAIGTDSGGYGLDHGASFTGELGILFSAGYSIEEAIRCATWNGARLLGLENELGVLRAGMPATFLVAEGSPEALLHSLSRPKLLFVEGSLISNFDISSHCTFLPDNLEAK